MTTRPDASQFFDDYQQFTRTTAIYPGAIKRTPEALSYCAFGLTEEAGEVAGKLKKRVRLGGFAALEPGSIVEREKDGKFSTETYEVFVQKIEKELGDVLWYTARIADEFGLSLSQIARINVEKLSSRKLRGKLAGSGDDR